jgi:hypothetical protein
MYFIFPGFQLLYVWFLYLQIGHTIQLSPGRTEAAAKVPKALPGWRGVVRSQLHTAQRPAPHQGASHRLHSAIHFAKEGTKSSDERGDFPANHVDFLQEGNSTHGGFPSSKSTHTHTDTHTHKRVASRTVFHTLKNNMFMPTALIRHLRELCVFVGCAHTYTWC